MGELLAEVIAIGDEMTSGQRLDTNSRWLSQQLGDLGVKVAYHSTVGDSLENCMDVFRIAGERANIVVMTGGLGPTADDLTRDVLANVSGCPLEFHPPTLKHIEAIYVRYNREMPERNKSQAFFPEGSRIIPNPEGTAPGIDLSWQPGPEHQSRFFCLPGVPAEMREMWNQTVAVEVQKMTGNDEKIYHHVLHCFGTGESSMEEMLGDLTERGRDPIVGITASHATISLRISTRAADVENFKSKLRPTLEEIERRLGMLIYGANDQSLAEIVLNLLNQKSRTLSVADFGLGGALSWSLSESAHLDEDRIEKLKVLRGCRTRRTPGRQLEEIAASNRNDFDSDVSLVIGPIEDVGGVPTYSVVLDSEDTTLREAFTYAGHSSFRHLRSVKQVLNMLRLHLLDVK